jgi:hypothetical protein
MTTSKQAGVSRRAFVRGSGAAAGASLLRIGAPALAAAAQVACERRDAAGAAPVYALLEAGEAAELEAIAARILPTTDTPGAREAGVIHFFDTVLGGPMEGMLAPLRGGLADFAPAEGTFAGMTEAEQDAWITAREDSPFFGMVRTLTLMGFFAMSSYGGNRENMGWKLIGFGGHGATSYPFGYYDAEYRGEEYRGDEHAGDATTGGAAHGH